MKLSPNAQKIHDYKTRQFLGGMISADKLLNDSKKIYQEDVEKQTDFLMDKGYTESGAIRSIYNLDRGGVIL